MRRKKGQYVERKIRKVDEEKLSAGIKWNKKRITEENSKKEKKIEMTDDMK